MGPIISHYHSTDLPNFGIFCAEAKGEKLGAGQRSTFNFQWYIQFSMVGAWWHKKHLFLLLFQFQVHGFVAGSKDDMTLVKIHQRLKLRFGIVIYMMTLRIPLYMNMQIWCNRPVQSLRAACRPNTYCLSFNCRASQCFELISFCRVDSVELDQPSVFTTTLVLTMWRHFNPALCITSYRLTVTFIFHVL